MNEALATLADEYWDYVLETSPTQALMLGVHDHDSRHEDASLEAEDAYITRLTDFVTRAEAIPTDALTADERITIEVLVFEASSKVRMAEGRFAEMDVNHAVGAGIVG